MTDLALPCPPARADLTQDGKIIPILSEGETHRQWLDRIKSALATDSDDLARYILATLCKACNPPEAIKLNSLLAQIAEGHPRDVQETLLLAQMAATSQRMLEVMGEKRNHLFQDDDEAQTRIISQYGRLYSRQLEALRRYRRDGNQRIVVLHAQNAVVGVQG